MVKNESIEELLKDVSVSINRLANVIKGASNSGIAEKINELSSKKNEILQSRGASLSAEQRNALIDLLAYSVRYFVENKGIVFTPMKPYEDNWNNAAFFSEEVIPNMPSRQGKVALLSGVHNAAIQLVKRYDQARKDGRETPLVKEVMDRRKKARTSAIAKGIVQHVLNNVQGGQRTADKNVEQQGIVIRSPEVKKVQHKSNISKLAESSQFTPNLDKTELDYMISLLACGKVNFEGDSVVLTPIRDNGYVEAHWTIQASRYCNHNKKEGKEPPALSNANSGETLVFNVTQHKDAVMFIRQYEQNRKLYEQDKPGFNMSLIEAVKKRKFDVEKGKRTYPAKSYAIKSSDHGM